VSPSSVWSVPVRVDEIPETGRKFDLVANEAIRIALARNAGVDQIPRLAACLEVARHGRDGLHVVGTVSATVVQTCVVTLERMESEVAESIDLTFIPGRASPSDATTERVGVSPEREPPEVLVDGSVDLGAVATEFLLLGIDPYPRRAGAVFAAPPVTDDPAAHPFAALAALKTTKQD
jgi:uncharacterized metal-binding protein YceD (DUF177 family)